MRILDEIVKNIKKSQKFCGDILFDVPMNEHTTFKIGGNADVLAFPNDEKSLMFLLSTLKENNVPFFILGGGSNIVVADQGIAGFVISTSALSSIKIIPDVSDNENTVTVSCAAGCSFETLTEFCIEHELSGLECFAGIPGTIGGTVCMNARCYGKSMSDVLQEVRYIPLNDFNTVDVYRINKTEWDYKKSPFQASACGREAAAIILSATLSLTKGVRHEIRESCNRCIEDRQSKGHFQYPSAGSVFKNDRRFGKSSGEIIDSVGLKGFRVGNAKIADCHGNFIINMGNASADDIKAIVTEIKTRVKKHTNFDLECEILFVGKFS